MEKSIKKIYRQGDVVIMCNSTIPKDSEKLSHLVLARGELTGHAHRITSGDAELYEKDGILYLRVLSESELTHDKHGTITLPKDDYEIKLQREYEPDSYREVTD